MELEPKEAALQADTVEAFQRFENRFPRSEEASLARDRRERISEANLALQRIDPGSPTPEVVAALREIARIHEGTPAAQQAAQLAMSIEQRMARAASVRERGQHLLETASKDELREFVNSNRNAIGIEEVVAELEWLRGRSDTRMCVIVLASPETEQEARRFATTLRHREAVRVYETSTGRFAITYGKVNALAAPNVMQGLRLMGLLEPTAYCKFPNELRREISLQAPGFPSMPDGPGDCHLTIATKPNRASAVSFLRDIPDPRSSTANGLSD